MKPKKKKMKIEINLLLTYASIINICKRLINVNDELNVDSIFSNVPQICRGIYVP